MYRLRSRNCYSPDEVMAAIEDISNSVLFPSLQKNLSRIMATNTLNPVTLPAIDANSGNGGRPSTVPILPNPSSMLSSKRLKFIVSRDVDSVSHSNLRPPPGSNLNFITRERLKMTLQKMKVSKLPFDALAFNCPRGCSIQKRN